MPSGPPELHERFTKLDPEGVGDRAAMKLLKDAGYKLSRQWQWTLPSPGHVPTEDENDALDYLVLEWDFGRLDPEQF